MNWPASVAKAVASVRDSIEAVEKKKSQGGGVAYAFQHWDDVVLTLRVACKDAGLIISPNIAESHMEYQPTRSGGQAACWRLALDIDLVAVEDGACHRCRWEGESNDSGDKGEQKAATSAYKYWALKTFQIATEDDTTDNDHVQAEPLAQVKRTPAAKPAPERPNTEPQAPAQPAKPADPLKTAKKLIASAAAAKGMTTGEEKLKVWTWFEAGRPQNQVVMGWGDYCAAEGSPEAAATRIVSLYVTEVLSPTPPTPAIEAEDPFADE